MENAHADDAAVVPEIDENRRDSNTLDAHAVQQKRPSGRSGNGRIPATAARELDSYGPGLIPAAQAAESLGIEEKRLRGYCLRNKVGDPIGGLIDGELYVYDWSLADLRKAPSLSGLRP